MAEMSSPTRSSAAAESLLASLGIDDDAKKVPTHSPLSVMSTAAVSSTNPQTSLMSPQMQMSFEGFSATDLAGAAIPPMPPARRSKVLVGSNFFVRKLVPPPVIGKATLVADTGEGQALGTSAASLSVNVNGHSLEAWPVSSVSAVKQPMSSSALSEQSSCDELPPAPLLRPSSPLLKPPILCLPSPAMVTPPIVRRKLQGDLRNVAAPRAPIRRKQVAHLRDVRKRPLLVFDLDFATAPDEPVHDRTTSEM